MKPSLDEQARGLAVKVEGVDVALQEKREKVEKKGLNPDVVR